MEVLKFRLWGLGATFKRPHTNTANFTYSHIHVISLFGIFGAMLGLKGHRDKSKGEAYPEFYEKLRGLKVAIVPSAPFFQKKMTTFTDTTNFSNTEGALIVKEQSLINPSWDIYVAKGTVDEEIYNRLVDALQNKEAVYTPFLGKNHFPCEIDNFEIVELEKVETEDIECIHSLFKLDDFEIGDTMDFETEEYEFKEYMPIRLTPNLNYYEETILCLTNKEVTPKTDKVEVFFHLDRYLYFL